MANPSAYEKQEVETGQPAALGFGEGRPLTILFNVSVDAGSYNAQSLNAREIALRLDRARFRSTCFFERSADPRLMAAGIRLVQLPNRRRTFRILREMLRGYDFIFYIDISPASFLYLHLPRRLRRATKTVLCVEGTRGNLDGVSPAVRRNAEYVLRNAHVRTAISEFVARDTYEAFGVKIDRIMPVGVDRELFSPATHRPAAVPTVLFVGHFIERKGAHLVLEVARRIPAAQFRMVGSVRDEFGRRMMSQRETILPPNVRMEGPVRPAELAQIMRQSDVLVLPSRVEGIPKVTLEAAAAGLPCVVFHDYQTPSVVDGKTGFQVSTLEEMVRGVQRLLDDVDLRREMGAAAVSHARQYDWNQIVAQWAALLQEEACTNA